MKVFTRTAVSLLCAGAALAAPTLHAETLEVTAWKGNDAEPAALPELIEQFEAANPDIDINFSYISRTDTDIVLPPRVQGDNPPDVMMTDMPLVKVWGEAGLLAPIDKGDWYDRLTPAVQAAISGGEDVYIMPLEVIGMGNFVNMGLLKQVGIESAPTTIDALKDACGKLKDAGIDAMIFSGGFSAPLYAIANGLERAPGSAAALGAGDELFEESDAFISTLSTFPELESAGCFDADLQAGLDPWSTALSEFKAGNFAMMAQGAWNIHSFMENESLDFVFAPIPSDKDTGVALDLFGIGWSIAAKSDQPEAAKRFVDFFTDNDNLHQLLLAESGYSPFADGESGVSDIAAPYEQARNNGGTIMFPFSVLEWPKPLEGEIFDSMTGYLLDLEKDPADVLSRWDEIIEDQ